MKQNSDHSGPSHKRAILRRRESTILFEAVDLVKRSNNESSKLIAYRCKPAALKIGSPRATLQRILGLNWGRRGSAAALRSHYNRRVVLKRLRTRFTQGSMGRKGVRHNVRDRISRLGVNELNPSHGLRHGHILIEVRSNGATKAPSTRLNFPSLVNR